MPVNNFKAIFTLLIFLIAEFLVIFPVYIPIPKRFSRSWKQEKRPINGLGDVDPVPQSYRIPLDFRTAPFIAVLLLLASECIHGAEVRKGIVGSDGVEPLNVMALFISLAYMVISVDNAGLLRFLAFWVACRSGTSGIRLYSSICTFFFVLGVIVGNDPVILSGVPFLAYFTRETGIDPPTAWIFAQFIIANIASAVLVSSNPTNLVLSGAFSISFFTYTAKIIVPVISATVFMLPLLLLIFRDPKFIPRRLTPITLSPRSVLVDPFGGIFGATILILTLCALVSTSFLHPQVYLVTVPPAVIVFLRDIVHDIRGYNARKHGSQCRADQEKTMGDTNPRSTSVFRDSGADIAHDTIADATILDYPEVESKHRQCDNENLATSIPAGDDRLTQGEISEKRIETQSSKLDTLRSMFPNVLIILRLMPFSLVVFSFSMFILVQGLAVTGWVDVWAGWWNQWVAHTGTVGSIFGMGLISCILCNVFGTNIGATILLARILQVWIQSRDPHPRIKDGAIYALALGSNYGAFTFSFPASLAGLLWKRLLMQKGIIVTMSQFARLNFIPVAVAMGVSSAVLIGQVYIIHR
ncbi:hypothetical protein FRC16_003366 [Serendipita sp. 398]|nr:hypothetical protein FRC16_003366 [Serendipita sp. 398]